MTGGFRLGIVGLALLATGLPWSGGATAATMSFSNNAAITIPPGPATSGNASPFPSTLSVAGLSDVLDVDVTLLDLSHSFSGDLEIIVEGPTGLRVALMVDVGGANNWTDDDVTLSDGAAVAFVPGSSGTFAPSGPGLGCNSVVFPQCSGAGSLLSVFIGVDPNGTWSLYIRDDVTGDTGNAGNGWRLTFTLPDPVAPVPEPATLAILGFGLAGLGLVGRRRRAA